MMRYLILLLPLLSGCWSGSIKTIRTHDEASYMTVGDTLYKPKNPLQDIQEKHLAWQYHKPQFNSDEDKRIYALLLHEAQHSKQMEGPVKFFWFMIAYNISKDFRWQMESEAFKIEIETLLKHGLWTDEYAEDFARIMADDSYRGMVSYVDARSWIAEITKGKP